MEPVEPAATEQLLVGVARLCREAGAAIMAVYSQADAVAVEHKQDDSPVTAADIAAHQVLIEGLSALQNIPVLSEEGALPPFTERRQWQRYWLVDPLDGTKEFISRNGEFTVNVALIDEGEPVLGVVHVPVTGVTYTGARGCGAHKLVGGERLAIKTRSLASRRGQPLDVVISRRHGVAEANALVEHLERQLCTATARRDIGSSLKLCLIAEGQADFYPRFGPTSEWDTAAAQAVVEAAGGAVLDHQVQTMHYNRKESVINPCFYVVGDSNAPWRELLHLQED